MSKRRELQRSYPIEARDLYLTRPDQVAATQKNRIRLANSVKKALVEATRNNRINLIVPTGIAFASVHALAGKYGTGELFGMYLAGKSFATAAAQEMIRFYQANPTEMQRSVLQSGLVSPKTKQKLDSLIRSGQHLQVGEFLTNLIGQAHQDLLQSPDPTSMPLSDAFGKIRPPRTLVEIKSGQLVAVESQLLEGRLTILPPSRLTPLARYTDAVKFTITPPATHAGTVETFRTITVTMPGEPSTLFVAGPGIMTAGAIDRFMIYPKSIYADRSLFIASIIATQALHRQKTVGYDLESSQVAVRAWGMENAAEDLSSHVHVAMLSMVHSAPVDAIHHTLASLARKMPDGSIIVTMNPDKVYDGETNQDLFSSFAIQQGLHPTQFRLYGNPVSEYTYSHPNVTPGKEIPDRQITLQVFRKLKL